MLYLYYIIYFIICIIFIMCIILLLYYIIYINIMHYIILMYYVFIPCILLFLVVRYDYSMDDSVVDHFYNKIAVHDDDDKLFLWYG